MDQREPAHPPAQQKAILFTHFAELKYGANESEWLNARGKLKTKYTKIFDSYLRCAQKGKELGLVYVYVDWAIRQTLPHVKPGTFSINPVHLGQEAELVDLLGVAEQDARDTLGLTRDDLPRCQPVGLFQLVGLLNKLAEVKPELLKLLGGMGGILFTYDSPKFVEAVIRLGRFAAGLNDPVIRIDEDATPTADFISKLLAHYRNCGPGYFFFSGTYGDPNEAGGVYKRDVINDYAVRTAWLADPQDAPVSLSSEGTESKLSAQARADKFLEGIGKLGAIQIQESSQSRGPQVISGAGLIMSPILVKLFPPFMNLKNLTIWVDDHLKRRLHEKAGDLPAPTSENPECLVHARIRQDRHPNGLGERDIDWHEKYYFDRLLRGCLFHHIITEPDASYAKLLKEIVVGRPTQQAVRRRQKQLRLMALAEEQYAKVKEAWSPAVFRGTMIHRWARGLTAQHRADACKEVTDDAIRYIDLVFVWHVFTTAIELLPVSGNYWLFLPARATRGLAAHR